MKYFLVLKKHEDSVAAAAEELATSVRMLVTMGFYDEEELAMRLERYDAAIMARLACREENGC